MDVRCRIRGVMGALDDIQIFNLLFAKTSEDSCLMCKVAYDSCGVSDMQSFMLNPNTVMLDWCWVEVALGFSQ